jgi:hypothetical protein
LDLETLKKEHDKQEDPHFASQKVYEIAHLTGEENYGILDAEGYYVGCNLSVDHLNPMPGFSWPGEGEICSLLMVNLGHPGFMVQGQRIISLQLGVILRVKLRNMFSHCGSDHF